MAHKLLLACALSLAAASETQDGLSLVQTHAKLQHKPAPSNKSEFGFSAMNAQVSELELSVTDAQKHHAASVAKARASYKEKLVGQVRANHKVAEASEKLSAEIKRLKENNAQLRKHATSLQEENQVLLEDQQTMEANLTTAKEFVAEALRDRKENSTSSDLDVLEELDSKERSEKETSEQEHRLNAIAKLGGKQGSLLLLEAAAVRGDRGDGEDEPKTTLLALEGQLESLQREQAAGDTFLKEEFEKRQKTLEDEHAELVAAQEELQSANESLLEQQARLEVAVRYLEVGRDASLNRSRSLRRFAQNVGEPTEAALLQVYAAKPSTFQEMNKQVEELEQRLTDLQHQNKAKLGSAKAAYERSLASQKLEIHAVVEANAKLSVETEKLKHGNTGLRADAASLQGDCSKLRSEMESLQGKLETSMEFVAEALHHQNETDAPELDVLKELNEEEHSTEAKQAHKQRFDEITSLALMEVGAKIPTGVQPKELLGTVESSFDQLLKEEENSEASLKSSFDIDFQAGASRLEEVFAEQKELNATKGSLEELQLRLKAAVGHLQHTQGYLQKRLLSLRGFVAALGDGSQPQQPQHKDQAKKSAHKAKVSLLQVAGEPEEDVVELSDPSQPTVALAMSSQIGALEKRVAQVQQENDAAIMKGKASYEHKLKAQQAENRDTAAANAAFSEAIAALEVANSKLQARADHITRKNGGLRKETLALQANLSVVEEFAERLLDSENGSAPELDVLRELESESAARIKLHAHEQRIGEIQGEGNAALAVSMLELAAGVARPSAPAGTDPSVLVKLLQNNLDALSEEQSERVAALKREFTEKFEAGATQHENLASEQKALEKTKASLTELNSRLEAAVAHLDGMHEQLQEGLKSLRAFMLRASHDKNAEGEASRANATGVDASALARKAQPSVQAEHRSSHHNGLLPRQPEEASWLSWFAAKVGAGRLN